MLVIYLSFAIAFTSFFIYHTLYVGCSFDTSLYYTNKSPTRQKSPLKSLIIYGSFTWFATEFDGEDTFFGKVVSHLCPDGELGCFSLSELKSVKGSLGLGIERDLYG